MSIPEEQDAYGAELKGYVDSGHDIEIVERDDGLISDGATISSYFAPFEQWADHEKKAITYAQGNTLDIGCGAGRVSLHLQQIGLPVTGIDNSPGAIDVCRSRGVQSLNNLSITQIGKNLGVVDTYVLYGNNLALLGSEKRARWLLRRMYANSSPDARIIGSNIDPYRNKNPVHLEYHQYNRLRGRLGGQVRIRIRYEKRKSPWFDYLLLSKTELESILRDTGWKIECYVDENEGSYVAIIKKGR